MLRRWVLGSIVLAFGIASGAVALVRVQGHGRKLSHIDVASLLLSSVDGRPLDAHALQGKAVVLNFWAPWCPPCRMEMPWLRKLQKHDQARLVVLGVVADPAEYEHAATLMQTGRAGYPFVKESPELVHEQGEPNSLPNVPLQIPDGTMIHAVQGVPPESTMFAYARDAENEYWRVRRTEDLVDVDKCGFESAARPMAQARSGYCLPRSGFLYVSAKLRLPHT